MKKVVVILMPVLLLLLATTVSATLADKKTYLQIYYTFDQPTNMTGINALDQSGKGNDGTGTGITATNETGVKNATINITTATDRESTGKTPAQLNTGAGKNWTISIWTYPSGVWTANRRAWHFGTGAGVSGDNFRLAQKSAVDGEWYIDHFTVGPTFVTETGKWVNIIVGYNGSHLWAYDGNISEFNTTVTGSNFDANGAPLMVGTSVDTTSLVAGYDEFCMWNATLTQAEIYEVASLVRCDGGTGGGGSPPVPLVSSLTVNAYDLYDAGAVNNFTARIYNITHSFTNSTTTGQVKFGNVANITAYSVNISSNFSGGYFNSTFNISINGSTTLNTYVYQVYVDVNASQLYTSIIINGLNISTPNQVNTSITNIATLRLKANTNISLNASAKGHFNVSTTLNITALSNITINLTFHDAEINVTLFDNNNKTLSDWTLNITPTNLTGAGQLFSTTTALITGVKALKGYTFTFTGIRTNTNIPNKNFTITSDTYYNLSLFGQAVHTISLEFFHEDLHVLFSTHPEANQTVTVRIIGPTLRNVTTSNGTLFITNLTPGDYELRYDAPTFSKRSYYVAVPLGGSEDIDLFLLNTSRSTLVIFKIIDENDNELEGAILKVLRRYVSLGKFETVEMSKADFNGQAPTNIVQNTEEYRFIVEYGNVAVFDSTAEVKITSTTPQIRVQLGASRLKFVQGLQGVFATPVTFARATKTFSYTYTDTNNFVNTGCLRVNKERIKGPQLIAQVCSSTTAATLQIQVNESTGTFFGTGFLNTSTNQSLITGVFTAALANPTTTFGALGALLTFILLIGIPAIATQNAIFAVILGVGGLAVTAAFGLWTISAGAIFGMFLAGLLIIISDKTGRG